MLIFVKLFVMGLLMRQQRKVMLNRPVNTINDFLEYRVDNAAL